MTKRTSKDNPIKRITLDSNVASAIVTQIAIALNVKLHTDKDEDGNILGVSAYIGNCIRLADHKTYLQTWVDNASRPFQRTRSSRSTSMRKADRGTWR